MEEFKKRDLLGARLFTESLSLETKAISSWQPAKSPLPMCTLVRVDALRRSRLILGSSVPLFHSKNFAKRSQAQRIELHI